MSTLHHWFRTLATIEAAQRYDPGWIGNVLAHESLIDELTMACRRNRVLREDRDAVRAIGARLYDAGGLLAMQAANMFIRMVHARGEFGPDNEDAFHPGEIDAAWDGIGKWVW